MTRGLQPIYAKPFSDFLRCVAMATNVFKNNFFLLDLTLKSHKSNNKTEIKLFSH